MSNREISPFKYENALDTFGTLHEIKNLKIKTVFGTLRLPNGYTTYIVSGNSHKVSPHSRNAESTVGLGQADFFFSNSGHNS